MNQTNDHGHGHGLGNAFSDLEFLGAAIPVSSDQKIITCFDSFARRDRVDFENFETSSSDFFSFKRINSRRRRIDRRCSKRRQTRKHQHRGSRSSINFVSLEVCSLEIHIEAVSTNWNSTSFKNNTALFLEDLRQNNRRKASQAKRPLHYSSAQSGQHLAAIEGRESSKGSVSKTQKQNPYWQLRPSQWPTHEFWFTGRHACSGCSSDQNAKSASQQDSKSQALLGKDFFGDSERVQNEHGV